MKYLKTFFRKKKKTDTQFDIFDVRDMCLELNDDGFDTTIYLQDKMGRQSYQKRIRNLAKLEILEINNYKYINIEIYKHTGNSAFEYSKISDEVERIIDYMSTWNCVPLKIFANFVQTIDGKYIYSADEIVNMEELECFPLTDISLFFKNPSYQS